jgi:uncharacterized protein
MGRPILLTTLTISLGFSVLMFSNFKPTMLFGLLMMITMLSALAAALTLLPSLMLHVELVTVWDLLKLKLGKDPQEGIPIFNGLSRIQIQHLLMAGNIKGYKNGKIVFRKGEISDALYVIISGELQIIDTPGSTLQDKSVVPNQVIATLKTGDVVGEMGLIRSRERSATAIVVASKTAELLRIDERMIKRLQWLYRRTAHRFFFNLMKILCDRLENTTRAFVDQTTTDRLTGLRNRDFFMALLTREVALSKCVKDKNPVSLIIISLDDLPRIALQNGYETADLILKKTGSLLEANTEEKDHLCRFNFNQFACVLPGTSLKDALTFCEQIRTHVESQPFQNGTHTLCLKVFFGVSSTNQKGADDVSSLINAAFCVLDRNRGVIATDIETDQFGCS